MARPRPPPRPRPPADGTASAAAGGIDPRGAVSPVRPAPRTALRACRLDARPARPGSAPIQSSRRHERVRITLEISLPSTASTVAGLWCSGLSSAPGPPAFTAHTVSASTAAIATIHVSRPATAPAAVVRTSCSSPSHRFRRRARRPSRPPGRRRSAAHPAQVESRARMKRHAIVAVTAPPTTTSAIGWMISSPGCEPAIAPAGALPRRQHPTTRSARARSPTPRTARSAPKGCVLPGAHGPVVTDQYKQVAHREGEHHHEAQHGADRHLARRPQPPQQRHRPSRTP